MYMDNLFWHSSSKQATGASEFEQDWCTSDYLFYYYYYYFTAQKLLHTHCLFCSFMFVQM